MFKINPDYFIFVYFDKKSCLFVDGFGFYGKLLDSIVSTNFNNEKAYKDV